jgi:YVTN family beta-propeller protein
MAWIAARVGLKFVVAFLLIAGRATTGHPAEARLEAPAASAGIPPQRIEQGGLALEFSLTPVSDNGSHQLIAGSDAIVRIRVTDGTSGEPLTGYRPKAWIVARRSQVLASEIECADKIRSLSSGSLATRADLNLNSYLLLTLNHDKTISVINPQVSFNASKLETLIVLPGNGADWVLSQDGKFLYVSIPDAGAVAIIDTTARRMIASLPTGDHSSPTQIALQPDGRYVWVGLDGTAEAIAIDVLSNTIYRRVAVGNGLHKIAFGSDGRSAIFSNSADDSVSIVDVGAMLKTTDLSVGKTPIALAYGSASRLVYVAGLNADFLTAIDSDLNKVVGQIPVKRGIVALAFEPEGRFALAVNQLESTVSVIDSATNGVIAGVQVVDEPDQIVFTQRYAYVRGLNSEKFTLLDLNELRMAKAAPVDIQAGQLAPAAMPDEIGGARMIAPTPEGNSAMIANGPDRTIYYYQEGMMAPTGTLSNYRRIPRGLLVLNRGLTETSLGEFQATVRLPVGGRLDVPLLIDQPRMVACFQIDVQNPVSAAKSMNAAAISIEPLFGAHTLAAGISSTLTFKLQDSATAEPLISGRDLDVMVFKAPGLWQHRSTARPLGDGVYELTLTFPDAGQYNFVFSVGTRPNIGAPLHSTVIVH